MVWLVNLGLKVGECPADAAVPSPGPGEAGGLRPRGLGGAQQLHDREVQRGEVLLGAQRQRGCPGEEAAEAGVSRPVNSEPLVNLTIFW